MENDSPWISTQEDPTAELGKYDQLLQGSWNIQESSCASLQAGNHSLQFEKGQCQWNEYTQNYSLSDDTLSFAGMRFLVKGEGEQIQLRGLDENCSLRLRRK